MQSNARPAFHWQKSSSSAVRRPTAVTNCGRSRSVVSGRRGIVLAAGGGLVAEAAGLERLLDACYTVWVQASPQEHWDRVLNQGDYRVRAGARDSEALADMRRILAQRESLYRMADARLDTSSKTISQALKELVELVAKRA